MFSRLDQAEHMEELGEQVAGLCSEVIGRVDNELIVELDLLKASDQYSEAMLETLEDLKANCTNFINQHALSIYKHRVDASAQSIDELDEKVSSIKDRMGVELGRFAEELNLATERAANRLDVHLERSADKLIIASEGFEKLYRDHEVDLQEKASHIDGVMGAISAGSMAQHYEGRADDEEKVANWLRYGALFCMVLVIIGASLSFYDSLSNGFELNTALYRLALAFMLSVPAAYLARESSRHREKEHAHRQKSLDLRAITPYLASLGEEQQSEIKMKVADRLFVNESREKGGKSEAKAEVPISAHEMIEALVSWLKASIKK
ncbi:hypothetical protein [Sinobacterium caligoides]|uniref:hypothetical protein n=1 Tax=Sinobacterium caligoides TaxID=933926 RepID=UPI0011CD3BE9|nr:hypothetical protein [Sinobacterium caligoides]